MPSDQLSQCPVWQKLTGHAAEMNRPDRHLKHLLAAPTRLDHFSAKGAGMFYDYSRQRVDSTVMDLLFELARTRKIQEQFDAMVSGKKINVTEKRAALHTASRSFSERPIHVDGKDVMPDIFEGRDGIRRFSTSVRSGSVTGSTGKPFKHVVVVGIGGSYLRPEFASTALSAFADRNMTLHFLANVDIHNFGHVISLIDPETTLWVVISKSYTTAETLANTRLAYAFMEDRGLDATRHVVTVTSKGSPGDDPSNPVLGTFYMYDFIGGRYSVTSAVGGLPLSLYLGYERFERFLKGAEAMDRHTLASPARENLPLIAALVSVWNNNLLNYPAAAIIPYAAPLSKLAPHIQQLNMESNGKSVTSDGEELNLPAGTILFGEPGTNAQHSFFQLAHQGRPFPVEFIGVIRPQYTGYTTRSKGVTNHQELWANLIAQADALAVGRESTDLSRRFSGNRPSSTLLLKDLSPESVGGLLAFYEAKTVYEAFIWGINPFDQFGVELGKTTASGIRAEMAAANEEVTHRFDHLDHIPRFYLETLFSGNL